MEGNKMEDDVVTETSFAERRGWKADRRGSTLCRIACTWKLYQRVVSRQVCGAIYLGFFGYDTWCPLRSE